MILCMCHLGFVIEIAYSLAKIEAVSQNIQFKRIAHV